MKCEFEMLNQEQVKFLKQILERKAVWFKT